MRLSISRGSLLPPLLFLSTAANALKIFERLSFGHLLPITVEDELPNWSFAMSDPLPAVYDDRVLLTQGWTGNKKASMWTNEVLESPTWMVDVEFRVAGSLGGGGNLQIWLVKDRPDWPLDLENVYAVEQFDGLALIIDQYGGQGGSIRGFLNDGTTNYKTRKNIDPLAFGHCYYPYRNLGSPSRLRLRQTEERFSVDIDDQPCFASDTIQIPSGYRFGIAAASAQDPDEFEVFRFVVNDGKMTMPTVEEVRAMMALKPRHRDPSDPLPLPQGPPLKKDKKDEKMGNIAGIPAQGATPVEPIAAPPQAPQEPPPGPDPADFTDAADYLAQKELSERDKPLNEHVGMKQEPTTTTSAGSESTATLKKLAAERETSTQVEGEEAGEDDEDDDEEGEVLEWDDDFVNEMFDQLSWLAEKIDYMHMEVTRLADKHDGSLDDLTSPEDQINFMARRIEHIEGVVMQIQKDVQGRGEYKDHFKTLQKQVEKTSKFIAGDLHENMSSLVSSTAPKLGWFLFVVVGVQLLLAGSYVAYKRKRAKSAKLL